MKVSLRQVKPCLNSSYTVIVILSQTHRLTVLLDTFFAFEKCETFIRHYNNAIIMRLPSLPNNSTPSAANMKNNRKNKSPKFPT